MSSRELSKNLKKLINEHFMDFLVKFICVHPVNLNIIKDEFPNCEFYEQYVDLNCGINIDRNEIMELDWNTLYVDSNIKMANGISLQNGNLNDYGSCRDLDLPLEDFSYTIYNSKGITLGQIVEIVYRLKGSKYNWFNEQLESFKIKSKTSRSLFFEVSFKYINTLYTY